MITRDTIIGALVAALLYVDTDDERTAEVLGTAERVLAAIAPIERRYDPPLPPGAGYVQAFFHLRGTSPFLLVDLAVVKHTSPEKFLVPEIHGTVIFLFNKENRVRVPHLDRAALEWKIAERCARLRARAAMFWIFFDKFLARGQEIEAVDFYYRLVLGSLVEALRIRHSPERHDFGAYYGSHDLPPAVRARLNALFFVRDAADLRAKRETAAEWFTETMAAIDGERPRAS